ncbi:hypothetical protein [Oleomonas cavernae]|uniref:hypothetical protein n=1 Tax=Oleomonas cavernae TaxID=2320859 RepID=UPI0011C49E5F|nr:hypothetical protein [Oleomonas cavernae]
MKGYVTLVGLLLVLAASPGHADDRGRLVVRDARGRVVERVSPGTGDTLIRRDAEGRRLGTVKPGAGDRLRLYDRDG